MHVELCRELWRGPRILRPRIDSDKPFISETGYGSFIGYQPELPPGATPDALAKFLIEQYLERECRGQLVPLRPEYGDRFKAEGPPRVQQPAP